MLSLVLNKVNLIFQTIEQFDTITIFRHVSPDGDAYASSSALKLFLQKNFPTKKILIASQQTGSLKDFFEPSDTIDEKVISESCAIICDTANFARIDGPAHLAQKIIKIDHHPPVDNYGDVNLVLDTISSCSEIIALLILTQKDVIDVDIARYLYAGMLTDTVSFSISNVNSQTLEIASKLASSGFDIGQVHIELFQVNDNVFDYVTYLRANATETSEGLIYCYIEPEILKKFNLSIDQAKEVVNVFKEKKSAQIWLLLLRQENGLYRTTMRSKTIVINDIAHDYGGGGHPLACATKDLNFEQTSELLKALNHRLSSQN